MSKRTKTVQFRVSEEEKEHLRKAAEDAGMSPSDYLRSLTLHPTVAVVDASSVVLIPSTITLSEADEALRARFRAVLTELKRPSGLQSPAPSAPAATPSQTAAQPPAEAPAAPAPVASPAPDSAAAPKASPGQGDGGMVGASSPSPAAPSPPAREGIGADPGENVQPAVAQVARCPHCGGTEGRHQSWCEIVRGESPVTSAEEAPEKTSMEQFVDRRVEEGEMRVVAEAEWRRLEAAPGPTAAPTAQLPAAAIDAAKVPCPACGTTKLPDVQCPECGRRPG